MFFRPKIQLIPLLIIALIIISCQKDVQYSIIPHITYNSFTILPNSNKTTTYAILQITFTDGDGDIGITQAQADVPGSPKADLFIYFLEVQDTTHKLKIIYNDSAKYNDTICYKVRIPYVTPSGKNKNIKGTIADSLTIYNFALSKNPDTIAFRVYLIDRALHKSNVITTPNFILRH